MKLNFKEWNIIYEALTEKAESIKNDLKWRIEYYGEESDEANDGKTKLATYTAILKKLEATAI